jgi:hypothetical protein
MSYQDNLHNWFDNRGQKGYSTPLRDLGHVLGPEKFEKSDH